MTRSFTIAIALIIGCIHSSFKAYSLIDLIQGKMPNSDEVEKEETEKEAESQENL